MEGAQQHALERVTGIIESLRVGAALLAVGLFVSGCSISPWRVAAGSGRSPVTYSCHRATRPIRIDGEVGADEWRSAEVLSDFRVAGSPWVPATSRTEARMLWDERNLYVAIVAWDLDIFSYHAGRDEPVWQEDVVETFLWPDDSRPTQYYEINVNAIGALYDGYIIKKAAGGTHRWSRWNGGIRHKAKVTGSLNDPTDEDKLWTVELSIPWASLPGKEGQAPQTGDSWRFHIARYDYSVYLDEGRELSSCAQLSRADFHLLRDFAGLIFEQ